MHFKPLRMIDLAQQVAKKRQSPRTKFIHIEDQIPIYQNFCFALLLFRQKNLESILEGKELVEKLLYFQCEDGNFPIFLHEYPKCFDYQMGLKVGAILHFILRDFSNVLGPFKERIQNSLNLILRQEFKKSPFWENRKRALMGLDLIEIDEQALKAKEWTDWIITNQISQKNHFALPYDKDLHLFMPAADMQEGFEPRPHPIEWLLSEGNFPKRLLKDHEDLILTAPLYPITFDSTLYPKENILYFWQGTNLIHSLFAKTLHFDLQGEPNFQKGDLFEAKVFVNQSDETEIFINDKKATVFTLGDSVSIVTPTRRITLRFELIEGTGDFCGHIFRANRDTQIANVLDNLYTAFDMQIGIRTLRRSPDCKIQCFLDIAELSIASPIA